MITLEASIKYIVRNFPRSWENEGEVATLCGLVSFQFNVSYFHVRDLVVAERNLQRKMQEAWKAGTA